MHTSLAARIAELAAGQGDALRELRRTLHRAPELSEQEFATTALLASEVERHGLTPQLTDDGRGLWADLGEGECCIAIRADIDALPIQTTLETSYRSQRDGVMHACGHDAHTAMGMGSLLVLRRCFQEGDWPERLRVRFLFQPAEETSTGGLHMIRNGALDGVRAALALHVDPTRPVGEIGSRVGPMTAGCDMFDVTISGRGGHGARPYLTDDAVSAAAEWISTTYNRVPRCHTPDEPIVLNVGMIRGGQAANVVPETVELSGTLRAVTTAGREAALDVIARVTRAVEETHGCSIVFKPGRHTPPLINDAHVAGVVGQAARDLSCVQTYAEIAHPSLGAEDFAFIATEVPSTLVRVGVSGPRVAGRHLHTPDFDIDENALPVGASLLALSALRWGECSASSRGSASHSETSLDEHRA